MWCQLSRQLPRSVVQIIGILLVSADKKVVTPRSRNVCHFVLIFDLIGGQIVCVDLQIAVNGYCIHKSYAMAKLLKRKNRNLAVVARSTLAERPNVVGERIILFV